MSALGSNALGKYVLAVLVSCCAMAWCAEPAQALDGGSLDNAAEKREPTPSAEVLSEAASQHAERLGLLAGADSARSLRSSFPAQVSPSAFMCPSGAWQVVFDDDGTEILGVYVSSEGDLLGFRYAWPEEESEGRWERAKRELTFEQALDDAREAVGQARGSFPEDLSLESARFVIPEKPGPGKEMIRGAPRWVFRWQRYDDRIRYQYSWIEITYSHQLGVLSYEDHYIGRSTRHKANVKADEVLRRARQVRDEHVNAMQERGMLLTVELVSLEVDPIAFVWEVPGDEGDFLVYRITWSMQWLDEASRGTPIPDKLAVHIDAETGEPPERSLEPRPDPPFGAPPDPVEAPLQAD